MLRVSETLPSVNTSGETDKRVSTDTAGVVDNALEEGEAVVAKVGGVVLNNGDVGRMVTRLLVSVVVREYMPSSMTVPLWMKDTYRKQILLVDTAERQTIPNEVLLTSIDDWYGFSLSSFLSRKQNVMRLF